MRTDVWECLDCGNRRPPDRHGRCAGCGSGQIVPDHVGPAAGSAACLLGATAGREVSGQMTGKIADAMLRRAAKEGHEMTPRGIDRWFAEAAERDREFLRQHGISA